MSRPNILVVITHDSGRQFGCYGAGVETPHIDRLGDEGVRFTNAFCTAPSCSAARASAWTGLYPHRHGLIGLTHRGFRLQPDVRRLPALLAGAGYGTHLFGVHHEEPDPRLMGYQHVVARPRLHSIPALLPKLRDFLASGPSQPFYANVGFVETHRPFPQRHPYGDADAVTVPGWLPDTLWVREDLAMLNGMVQAVDGAVGQIDAMLREAGLADNTLLICTTDHGIAFPNAKATLRDAGIGVALVARGPGGFDGGRRIDRLVSTMDLTPTLLELAGADVPDGLDGRSLLPLVRDPDAEWRSEFFPEMTYHASYDPMRAVRTERHKYIRSFESRPMMLLPNTDDGHTKSAFIARGAHRVERPMELLYDLSTDPDEMKNLAGDPAHADTLAELRGRVQRHMETTDDPLLAGPVPRPDGAIITPLGAITPEDMHAPNDWRVHCDR